MTLDLRTEINDCDANTGWAGDATPDINVLTGQRYEGSASIDSQHSDVDEETFTTEDSLVGGTFSHDWSDSTLYMLVKDNLVDTVANGGLRFLVGDGTNRIGYDIGGNDAVGMPLSPFFNSYKLDMSNRPTGTAFTEQAGSEANFDPTGTTTIGYGSLHLAKAQGNVANVFLDYFSYIDNGAYALRINGGVSGSAETMADVQGDDVTDGWGVIANPLGSQFQFMAPTEWGEPTGSATHYFQADNEQWFWIGDNGGGHAMGETHFPFRVVGNSTDTGSFILNSVSIVNTGTRVQLLLDSADIDFLEIDGCTLTSLGTIGLPSAGGASRFVTDTIFNDCDQLTHNGASINGSSVLLSIAGAGLGAVLYNETADPDGEMDDLAFSQGAAAHSAIEFGTSVTSDITLRGIDFTGFGSTDDVDGAVFKFLATGGSLNLNLVSCTTDGTFSVDDSAGIVVTVVINPVQTLVHVTDNLGVDLEDARVLLEASDGTGDFPFEESVSIVRSGATATVTHTSHGLDNGDIVVIRGADQPEYNGPFTIANVSDNNYDYTVSGSPDSPATGAAIISSGAILNGLTDSNGDISVSRSFTGNTPVKGSIRKSTLPVRFKSRAITGTIDASNGLTINVRMVVDE